VLVGAGRARDVTLLRAIDNSDGNDTCVMAACISVVDENVWENASGLVFGDVCVLDPRYSA